MSETRLMHLHHSQTVLPCDPTTQCIRLVETSVVCLCGICCGDNLSLSVPTLFLSVPTLFLSSPVYRKVHTKAKIEIQLQGTGL